MQPAPMDVNVPCHTVRSSEIAQCECPLNATALGNGESARTVSPRSSPDSAAEYEPWHVPLGAWCWQ